MCRLDDSGKTFTSHENREECNVVNSNMQCGLQEIDAGDLSRELITQLGCHGVF